MTYRKNYIGLRFRSLPSNGEVVLVRLMKKHLGISTATYWNWTRQHDWKTANVVFEDNAGRRWARLDRLYNWLVHIGAIVPRPEKKVGGRIVKPNPPVSKHAYRKAARKAARKGLGL